MQVIINGTDITDYIVTETYKMDSEETFESWLDGNKVEHRIIVAEKVKGTFDVVLTNKNNMPTADFLTLWNSAITDGYITMLVYVANKAENKMINAYYTMQTNKHEKLADGTFLDVLTIEIQER